MAILTYSLKQFDCEGKKKKDIIIVVKGPNVGFLK